VADRVGHDRRYSLDASKLAALGFRAKARFDEALAATIDWYVAHPDWWRPIKEHDPHYRDFYKTQYHERLRS
jgi:dTDP-glucose 4,6-dehydratase